METVGGIVILFCIYYALRHGSREGWRRLKGAYRSRVKAWAGRRTPPAPLSSGRKLAAGAATALTGGRLAARGFAAGWKVGWPEGRRRAEAWAQRRAERQPAAGPHPQPVPHVDPGPVTGTASPRPAELSGELVPVPSGTGTVPAAGHDADDWSRPRLIATGDGTRRPALHAVPAAGLVSDPDGADNPDAPAAGGATNTPTTTEGSRMEILNYEQLLAWLKKLSTESASEIEDAQAGAARAAQDAAQIEQAWASLKDVDMDPETLSQVSGFVEPFNQRRKAAEDRAAAAEQIAALAEATLKGVQDRHGLMAEAHAQTPHAAEKPFYAG